MSINSKCPVAHLWMNKKGEEGGSASKNDKEGPNVFTEGGCPVVAGNEKRIDELDEIEEKFKSIKLPREGGVTSCPLGFGGSGGGPAMSQLHCVICKSLMYHASVTNCGHRFCRECIEKCRDCPVCGADVVKVEPDEATEGMVERFIDAHAGHVSFWELEEGGWRMEDMSIQSDESSVDVSKEKARFLLQAGIRALSGGNVVNAKHRFLQCVDVLENCARASEESKRNMPNGGGLEQLESQLGAVYGCIGDCDRRNGGQEAISWYEKSVDALERAIRCAGKTRPEETGGMNGQIHDNNEVMHSLSITLNKMGELYHEQGDVSQAAELYSRALEIREGCLDAYMKHAGAENAEAEIEVALALDVAISQLKIADALRSVADDDAADKLIAKAKHLVQTRVCGKMHECRSASSHDKYSKLQTYLGMI